MSDIPCDREEQADNFCVCVCTHLILWKSATITPPAFIHLFGFKCCTFWGGNWTQKRHFTLKALQLWAHKTVKTWRCFQANNSECDSGVADSRNAVVTLFNPRLQSRHSLSDSCSFWHSSIQERLQNNFCSNKFELFFLVWGNADMLTFVNLYVRERKRKSKVILLFVKLEEI